MDKRGKATGQDSIAAEMLKALDQNGKIKLLKIINRVLGLMNCHKNFYNPSLLPYRKVISKIEETKLRGRQRLMWL